MSGKRCISLTSSSKSPKGGSASSVSISFSSETTDDHPSTSGCSSMHVTGHEFRKLKKEKVKAYIQQIKSMVPPSKDRGKKTGTLKALQHVIDKLKNLKDNKDESKFNSFDDSAAGSVSQYSGSSIARSTEIQSKPQKESFMVAVTLDCRVESVDSTLLQYLGYPKDSWHGHLLTSFTSRKDIITVNNMLSKNESVFKRFTDPGGTINQKDKVIYFRLRYYKHLNEGYGLKRPDKFCAFHASVTTQVIDTPASEKERIDPSGMKKTKHFILKCVPLHSAYIVGSMPKNFSFSTTHSLYCNLNYIGNSAITLLGFLPQDLIGLSVFELYHPDDLPYLYTVYQRIVSSKGKAFKSEPYRMRTRNQNWVYVETEWSASVNQWSKWFEHISGQHTVVRVPENPNVFDEENSKAYPILSDETQLQQQKLQRRIQDLLLQQTTSDDSAIITLPSKPSTPFDAATTAVTSAKESDNTADIEKNKTENKSKETLMTAGSFVEEVIRYQNDGNVSPAVSHSSSPQLIFDSDTSITYEQLNYSYNIKRFLLSQPKTYHSDNSDKEDSKSPNLKNVKDVLDGKRPKIFIGDSDICEEGDFTSVDIPILNPPSFGSSTKVLVSEQEPRETISPPVDEYFEDFIMHKELSQTSQVFSDGQNLYQPVALTPEVLRMHTKFQERLYVQQATSDSSLFELDRGRSSDNSGNSNVKRSKRHLPESGEQETYSHPMKVPRFDDSYMSANNVRHTEQSTMSSSQTKPGHYFNKQQSFYQSSFPLNMSYPKFQPQHGYQNLHNTFQQYQQSKMGLYSQAIPVLPYDTAIHMTTNTTTPTATQMNYSSNTTANSIPNTYWPCYAQTGMSFMPTQLVGGTQLMGGFYQPMPGMFQTFATPISYSTNLPSMTTNKTTMQESMTPPSTMHMNPMCNIKGPITSSNMSKHESMKQPTKISDSSGSTSSQEETSSSLLYLLETGSYNTSSSTPDDIENMRKNRRLPRDPFWLQSTNWSSNIRMKYTVPQKSMKRILKEDNEKLNSLYQPKPLLEQLKDLKTRNPKMPVINEEDDFLIFFDESTQLSDNRLKGEEEEEEDNTSTQSQNEDDEDEENTELVVFVADELQNKSSMMGTSREKSNKTLEDESKEQNNSEKIDSSDNDDDKSESSSKNSSCITPSDQRSNEEAGSSLKESDGASKESDSGSKESDNGSGEESKPTERPIMEMIDYDSFHELFIPLTLRMNKKSSKDEHKVPKMSKLPKLPYWRVEADMNKNIEMNYQLCSKNLSNILESDQRRMNNLEQPSMVQEQLQVLLGEINSQDPADTASLIGAPCSSNISSCKNSCSDATATTVTTAVTATTPLPNKSTEFKANDKNVKKPLSPNQEIKNEAEETKDSMNLDRVSDDAKVSEDAIMSTPQNLDSTDATESHPQESTNVEMSLIQTQEDTAPLPSSSHTKTLSSSTTAEGKLSSSTAVSTNVASSDSNKLSTTQEMDDVFDKLFLAPAAEEISIF